MPTVIRFWRLSSENLGVIDTHMRYSKLVDKKGVLHFSVDSDITLDNFKLLMGRVASAVGSRVEWIAMPEAEIGKIKADSGCIYAKLDFEYGLEFDCEGMASPEIATFEAILSSS